MHFDGNHFSFSAIWTCFLKNKNGRARKSYKKSVSLTSNKCSCLNLRKNQRKQTKKKMCWFWNLNRGPWDYNIGLASCRIITTADPDWFPTLKVWVFIIKNVESWSGGTSNPGCATCFKYTASNQLVTNTGQLEFLLRFWTWISAMQWNYTFGFGTFGVNTH